MGHVVVRLLHLILRDAAWEAARMRGHIAGDLHRSANRFAQGPGTDVRTHVVPSVPGELRPPLEPQSGYTQGTHACCVHPGKPVVEVRPVVHFTDQRAHQINQTTLAMAII